MSVTTGTSEAAALLGQLTAILGPEGAAQALRDLLDGVDAAVRFLAVADSVFGRVIKNECTVVPVDRAEQAVTVLRSAMDRDELAKLARLLGAGG
jgi:hypothetical protein